MSKREVKEEAGGLWSKYWLKSGVEVVRRDDVTDLNVDRMHLYKMVVERVLKRSKEGRDGSRRTFIEGVRCHWVDGDRKFQQGVFHTNELIPFEIAKKGVIEVNRWIER